MKVKDIKILIEIKEKEFYLNSIKDILYDDYDPNTETSPIRNNYLTRKMPNLNSNELQRKIAILHKSIKKEFDNLAKDIKTLKKDINPDNCHHLLRYKENVSTVLGYDIKHYCLYCDKELSKSDNSEYILFENCSKKTLDILKQIIKNKDDMDEINIIHELKMLNLDHHTIKEKNDINYNLLIIGGTNNIIVNDTVISGKTNYDILQIINYFVGLLKTKITIIDNQNIYNTKTFNDILNSNNFSTKNKNIIYFNYNTVGELNSILEKLEDQFNVIIDMTNLITYSNNSINKININLKVVILLRLLPLLI